MRDRRNFLKMTGFCLTGSLLKPVSSNSETVETRNVPVKIGVILPRANQHSAYPDSFLKGLRLGIGSGKTNTVKTELITESINNGTTLPAQAAVHRLIKENNVDLITGLLSNEVAGRIGKILKDEEVPALISNAGENFMLPEVRRNPFLFFNTLNLFQASFEAGKYMVSKHGKNVCIVTTLADSGYDTLFAFRKGVEIAGGSINDTFVFRHNRDNFWDNTINTIKHRNPDGIFVLLNGKSADLFLGKIRSHGLHIPMITTSFAADDNRIKHLGESINGTEHFSSWNQGLKTQANKKFIHAYQTVYHCLPDQFGFLGYQSGLLLRNSVNLCAGPPLGIALRNALEACRIQSPTGTVSVNKQSGLVKSSVFLCQSRSSNFNLPENIVLHEFSPDDNLTEIFSLLETGLHSGFINPYLFA